MKPSPGGTPFREAYQETSYKKHKQAFPWHPIGEPLDRLPKDSSVHKGEMAVECEGP